MQRSVSELALIALDDVVVTPGGAQARVIAVDKKLGEALVQWPNGDQAHFRIIQLRRMPRMNG